MEIEINRYNFGPLQCEGTLKVNEEYLCDTLEPKAIDWSKQRKVKGKTAIPEGRYRLVMSYSTKFHREMPYLENVPEFTGIMIHTGNVATRPDGTSGDSQGCILVGTNMEQGRLHASRVAFEKLNTILHAAISIHEEVWVTVTSERKWTYKKK